MVYVTVTLLCGLFSSIYEHFSHEVYSVFMVYLFTAPLILGVLPETLGLFLPRLRTKSSWTRLLHHFAVTILTVGCALRGVFEIYGTTNDNVTFYFIAGVGLLIISSGLRVREWMRTKRIAG